MLWVGRKPVCQNTAGRSRSNDYVVVHRLLLAHSQQLAPESNADDGRLCLGVMVECFNALLAPMAALLETAEWSLNAT